MASPLSLQKMRLTRLPDSGSTPRIWSGAGLVTNQPLRPSGLLMNSSDGGVLSTRHHTGQVSDPSSGSFDVSVNVAVYTPSAVPTGGAQTMYMRMTPPPPLPSVFGKVKLDPGGPPSARR